MHTKLLGCSDAHVISYLIYIYTHMYVCMHVCMYVCVSHTIYHIIITMRYYRERERERDLFLLTLLGLPGGGSSAGCLSQGSRPFQGDQNPQTPSPKLQTRRPKPQAPNTQTPKTLHNPGSPNPETPNRSQTQLRGPSGALEFHFGPCQGGVPCFFRKLVPSPQWFSVFCGLGSKTLNPQPQTRSPEPSTLNPKPQTLNPTPKPSALNPNSQLQNPKPLTLNP